MQRRRLNVFNVESTKGREVASQLGCVCRMAAHEGHRSGFCDYIGMGTDGDGRRLVWRARRGNLASEPAAWKAPSLPSAALPESTEVG